MKYFLFALAASSTLVACGGGGSSSSAPRTGDVSLAMTDAPADDLSQVHLTINAVAFKPASGPMKRFDLEEPLVVENLLELQGAESTVILPTTRVPAGRYNWVRLYVQSGLDDSYVIESETGGQYQLYVPGQQNADEGKERHVQLVSGFIVPVNGEVNFTLDVDLRRAITKPSGKDYYLLRPAIRMVDNSEVGVLRGTVSDALTEGANCSSVMDGETLKGNAVYLYSDHNAATGDIYVDEAGKPIGSDNPLTAANVSYNPQTDAYEYEIGFVPAGPYTLAFTCQALDDMPDADDSIAFSAQKNVNAIADDEVVEDLP